MCEETDYAAIDLPLDVQAARFARDFLSVSVCHSHGNPALDDARLLTSELISNAVVYGGSPIRLSVACHGDVTEVRVRDGAAKLPARREAADLDTGGRGLMLVDTLAESWGVEPVGRDAKEVWFRISHHVG